LKTVRRKDKTFAKLIMERFGTVCRQIPSEVS